MFKVAPLGYYVLKGNPPLQSIGPWWRAIFGIGVRIGVRIGAGRV